MKEFDIDLIDKLKELIEAKDSAQVLAEIKDLHPADIAELVSELDDTDDSLFLLQLLDNETVADVLVELDEDERADLLEQMPNETIAKTLEEMDANDAVDLIQELDKDDQEDVISHIDDVEQAGDIVDLLQYDDDTAGGHMSTEMVVVNENLSMPDCIKAMREQAEDMDEIYNIYVVDDDNRLKGVFPLKKTITNPSANKIKYVMEPNPISVKTDTPIEDVALDFEKYDLVAMPVVDSIGRLVGRITVDDIMDEVREQSERDYQLATGLTADVETSDSVWTQFKARFPWLLIGIGGGIANALILDGDDTSWQSVLPGMALFIPLIGGTGGNVGTQSSAIVVQGLANGSLELKKAGKYLGKEFFVALLNAVLIAGLVFLYNLIWPADDDPAKAHITSLAVTISLFSVVLFASVFGTFVPIVLEKLKIDPAIATGPFVTVTNDIVGMLIYMLISSQLITAMI
ncbi:MAG: magnesium transporter [Muribaculaceae bacterium]|nr:magnesium transporter [Muribaculaceae bacterium]MBQ2563316.1 magnesium transporter [Muribaculaceae bacterium]MBQ5409714.1 magnesium transporter [Muribaculaceae bacterium]MBQ5508927.1 magnesium transporter [Muribaculaceae bacterium]